ncbi:uncharacterized protein [Littorina saxatilis]|uniref:uncharacterized protein isoform X1 n=1 Tax=Littorina saxatilis TaxID=31220 RepID=UPI0038B50365
MDHLEQAKTLYRKRHDHASVISPDDHVSLSMSITKMIRTCLIQQGGVASFKYLPFLQVIKRTVASNQFQGDRAAMAFSVLEKYLLLLVAQPWKREFWLLKTYGGYFCTKVKAHLDGPEEILELVGYAQEECSSDDNQLALDRPPDREVALNVAFDCQVAAVECQFIGEYYDKMRCVGLDLSDAMNVLLSGAHNNDPILGSPVVSLQGKNLHAGGTNNHFVNTKSDTLIKNGGRMMPPPPPPPQRILASGGMGVGVVSSGNMHQVTGVPPRPMVAHQDLRQAGPRPVLVPQGLRSYSDAADPSTLGLKVDLPEMRHQPGLVEAGARTQYIAAQPAGSRASYGSSVYAPSSGYGSASASVYSAPSSAYTASSGYNSGALSQPSAQGHYVYPPNTHIDHVDSPQMTVRGQPQRPPRHTPLPHQPPPNFPYIDEDESPSAPFPEATHEEHLRESLRNLQGAGPDKNRSKTVPMMTSSEVIRRPPQEEVPAVPYDDWRWFRKDQPNGPPPAYDAVVGSSHPSSTMIHRPSHLSADNMSRSNHVQPATAVTAMLNHGPMAGTMDMKRHVSPMDGRQPRGHSGDYPPLTVLGGHSAGTSPLPDSAHNRRAVSSSADCLLQDGVGRGVGVPQSHTVYYPPASQDAPFQRYSNTMTGPPFPQRQAPTFAQMTSGGRMADNPALLSRQAQNVAFNNLDKVSQAKQLNVARDGSGSSSEVIMRSKVRDMGHGGRANSLVSPHTAGHPPELNRQSSRSMDLGLVKWRCRTCTMENSSVEIICAACSKSRDAPDVNFPIAGESKVVCPSCTFENPAGHKACEICSSPLSQDVHTYV